MGSRQLFSHYIYIYHSHFSLSLVVVLFVWILSQLCVCFDRSLSYPLIQSQFQWLATVLSFFWTFSLTRLWLINLLIQANVLVTLFKLCFSNSWCWISSIVCIAAFKISFVAVFSASDSSLALILMFSGHNFDWSSQHSPLVHNYWILFPLHPRFQYRLEFVELVHISTLCSFSGWFLELCWWQIHYNCFWFSTSKKQQCYLSKRSNDQQNISFAANIPWLLPSFSWTTAHNTTEPPLRLSSPKTCKSTDSISSWNVGMFLEISNFSGKLSLHLIHFVLW